MEPRDKSFFRDSRLRRGFTLLEVILAMAVLGLIIGGMVSISAVVIRMVASMNEAQMEMIEKDQFERLLRENISHIEADSSIRLIGPATRLQMAGDAGQVLVLSQANGIFPVAGLAVATDSVAIETRRDRAGLFSVNILYYAEDYWSAVNDGAGLDEDLLTVVPFRRGLVRFDWSAYDPAQDEWFSEWEEGGRRPHFLELIYQFAGEYEETRMVFWLPPQRPAAPLPGQRGAPAPGGENGDGEAAADDGRPGTPGGSRVPGRSGVTLPPGVTPDMIRDGGGGEGAP